MVKTRSIQQFKPKVTHDDTKKRSLQQFELASTQDDIKLVKARSVQQFQYVGTQNNSQSKNRPQSILGYIPKPLIKGMDTGNTNLLVKAHRASLSRLGSFKPILESIREMSMKSFNHSYTFPLGKWTLMVFEMENLCNSHVLQVYSGEEWHPVRYQLVDIARLDHRLVPTHFVFYDEEHEIFCIGLEEVGICLVDVVSCSWQMNEVVASVILSEVKLGLQSSYHAHPKSSKIVQALYNLRQ